MNIKIIKNAAWMMSEKTVTIIGLFLVTSYVAKYVGPSTFGIISLATATFQIIQIIAQLGNDNIIFKRVSKNEKSGVKLINATLLLRTAIYIVLSIPTLYYFYEYKDHLTFVFSIAICIACFFTSIDIYSIYNNAILNSKTNTIVNIIGLCIGLTMQYVIVFNKLDPLALTIPIIITTLIPLSIRYYFFKKKNKIKLKSGDFLKYNKYIIMSGLSIVFSTLSIAIYTRVNQFMISYLEGNYNLGVYSVAVTLATSWAFVVAALINSTLPSIFGEKDNAKALRMTANLNIIVILVSCGAIAFLALFGNFFIQLLYGDAYKNANGVMMVLCLSTMISNLGAVSSRYIIRFSGYSFLSKKMFCMVLLSVPISYTMIAIFGLIGAAYSVLAIEILSLTVMNYFFKRGIVAQLHMETINLKKLNFKIIKRKTN